MKRTLRQAVAYTVIWAVCAWVFIFVDTSPGQYVWAYLGVLFAGLFAAMRWARWSRERKEQAIFRDGFERWVHDREGEQ